jgi:hypothetical protein
MIGSDPVDLNLPVSQAPAESSEVCVDSMTAKLQHSRDNELARDTYVTKHGPMYVARGDVHYILQ